ncbi:hypothetical protein D3C84_1205710 [compost metagenome]
MFIVQLYRFQGQPRFGARVFARIEFQLWQVGFSGLRAIGGRFAEQAVGPRFFFVLDGVPAGTQVVFALSAEFGGRLDFPLFEAG